MFPIAYTGRKFSMIPNLSTLLPQHGTCTIGNQFRGLTRVALPIITLTQVKRALLRNKEED